MPIIRCSTQGKQTLEEFYKKLSNEKNSEYFQQRGKSMLLLLEMINNTFINTTLYGLTSHDTLCVFPTDSWEFDWFLAINGTGKNTFKFKYKMPSYISPWENALVIGHSNLETAKDFLIIAMVESNGWPNNKELRKLYNVIKDRKADNPKFKLWLEFEEADPTNWDIENEFCNIHVDLEDGRHYGLKVWTYKFLETAINLSKESGENLHGLYQTPPDLFVKELTRDCIKKTIEDLLKIGDLDKVLNSSIYSR